MPGKYYRILEESLDSADYVRVVVDPNGGYAKEGWIKISTLQAVAENLIQIAPGGILNLAEANLDFGQGTGKPGWLYRSGNALTLENPGQANIAINIAGALGNLKINGTQVVGAQGAAIADVTTGVAVQVALGAIDCLTKINLILAALRAHGIIAA